MQSPSVGALRVYKEHIIEIREPNTSLLLCNAVYLVSSPSSCRCVDDDLLLVVWTQISIDLQGGNQLEAHFVRLLVKPGRPTPCIADLTRVTQWRRRWHIQKLLWGCVRQSLKATPLRKLLWVKIQSQHSSFKIYHPRYSLRMLL